MEHMQTLTPIQRDLIHPNGAYVTIVGDKVSRTVMGGPQTYLSYPSQVLRFLYGLVFGPRYANIMLQKKPAWLEKAAQMAQEGMTQVAVCHLVFVFNMVCIYF